MLCFFIASSSLENGDGDRVAVLIDDVELRLAGDLEGVRQIGLERADDLGIELSPLIRGERLEALVRKLRDALLVLRLG